MTSTKFHGRANSSLFPSNRPLWTSQCRLLLVDNLTLPLTGWGQFCRRNAARKDSCVHFKWKRIPGKASFVFRKPSSNDQYNNEIRQIYTFISSFFWFVAIPYKLLNVADVIIMHGVEKQYNLCAALNVSLGCLWQGLYFLEMEMTPLIKEKSTLLPSPKL